MQKHSRLSFDVFKGLAALVLVAGLANTALAGVYAVDRVVGPGRITGSIETNGTIGALTSADIIDWNLTIDADGIAATSGQLLASNSTITFLTDGVLTATPTGLFFDFSMPGFSILQISTPGYDVSWQLQGNIFSDELIRESLFPDLVQAFRQHEPVPQLIAGTAEPSFVLGLRVDQLRIRDDRGDRVRLNGRLALDASSDGIDPANEDVTLELSTASGAFYPGACAVIFPIAPGEFELVSGQGPRRWRLTAAARARTGIERFEIAEGSVLFVDRHTSLPTQRYDNVRVELTIGNDHATVEVPLLEHPVGSGRWRER